MPLHWQVAGIGKVEAGKSCDRKNDQAIETLTEGEGTGMGRSQRGLVGQGRYSFQRRSRTYSRLGSVTTLEQVSQILATTSGESMTSYLRNRSRCTDSS